MHVLAVAGYDKLNSNGSGALRYMVRVPAPGIPPARLEPGCVHGHIRIPMALPFAVLLIPKGYMQCMRMFY
jgi:hypothetical protein